MWQIQHILLQELFEQKWSWAILCLCSQVHASAFSANQQWTNIAGRQGIQKSTWKNSCWPRLHEVLIPLPNSLFHSSFRHQPLLQLLREMLFFPNCIPVSSIRIWVSAFPAAADKAVSRSCTRNIRLKAFFNLQCVLSRGRKSGWRSSTSTCLERALQWACSFLPQRSPDSHWSHPGRAEYQKAWLVNW